MLVYNNVLNTCMHIMMSSFSSGSLSSSLTASLVMLTTSPSLLTPSFTTFLQPSTSLLPSTAPTSVQASLWVLTIFVFMFICIGSLLVAIIITTIHFLYSFRKKRRGSPYSGITCIPYHTGPHTQNIILHV